MRERINYYQSLVQAGGNSQDRETSERHWKLAGVLRELNADFVEESTSNGNSSETNS